MGIQYVGSTYTVADDVIDDAAWLRIGENNYLVQSILTSIYFTR